MKNYRFYTVLMLAFAAFTLASCVPNRKYNELKNSNAALERNYRDSLYAFRQMRAEQMALRKENTELSTANREQDRKLAELQMSYNQTQRLNKDLQELYEKLLDQNKTLTSRASSETLLLNEKQALLQNQLDLKERELARLSESLEAREKANALLEKALKDRESNIANLQGSKTELEKSLAEREAKVKEMDDLINLQRKKSQELKDRVNQALRGFESSELTVEERNGLLYVSLSQKLLFASGSKTIDKRGKEALAKLAEVLNKNTDTRILIEGHTDSDGDDLPNWSLSTERAVSVVSELTRNGVDPKRVTAAGRGEHIPVAPNITNDGKAKNRRTEIILSPDLSELYEVIQKD
jgi:chemotaxis protein MotB